MNLKEIIAEWLYLKDNSTFSEQNSNIRDHYFRQASEQLPQLLSCYFSNRGNLQKLVRGSIQNFINAHGNIITKENYDSLARRIVGSIKGEINESTF